MILPGARGEAVRPDSLRISLHRGAWVAQNPGSAWARRRIETAREGEPCEVWR